MKLDKRIIEGKKPLTCFDTEVAKGFIGKECYLSDGVTSFANVDNLNKAVLREIDEAGINPYMLENTRWRYSSNFILPCEWVKESEEQEKKYRPYSIAEFLKLYQVGDIVEFRAKNCDEFYRVMFIGYITNSNRSMDEKPGEIDVMLGNYLYSLSHLFEDYELFFEDEWQPFGVEGDEE